MSVTDIPQDAKDEIIRKIDEVFEEAKDWLPYIGYGVGGFLLVLLILILILLILFCVIMSKLSRVERLQRRAEAEMLKGPANPWGQTQTSGGIVNNRFKSDTSLQQQNTPAIYTGYSAQGPSQENRDYY